MKKLGIFVMSLAVAAFTLSSCKKDKKDPDIDNIVENGFYVAGEAVGYQQLNVLCQFAPGRNEAKENALRDGMYEKYIVIEANKPFKFIKKEGGLNRNYGANLQATELPTDAQPVPGYKGSLAENVEMKVAETGLYHIVLDFDQDQALKDVGGAQVVLAKIDDWGIGGSINSWGYLKCDKAENYVYTWNAVEFAGGSTFKFKNLGAWKLNLDVAEQVKANANLGKDGVPGGDNISVEAAGVYKVTLAFKLAKGDIANSFEYKLEKSGDLVMDPATFPVGISGTMNGWKDPEGLYLAKYDANASQVTDATNKNGSYVFNLTGITFADGAAFKFRSNGAWLAKGDITVQGIELGEDADGNITCPTPGTYDIKITLVWENTALKEFKVVFTEGTPSTVERKDISLSATVPAGWTKCYIWAWNSETEENYSGGNWPGEELTIENGKVAKAFNQVAVPLNVIFSNGDGAQTKDLENVQDGAEIDIQANLK
jgi:hypothetical protein